MVLSRTLQYNFGGWDAADLTLCGGAVEDLFAIPDWVETITINLSIKKTKNSYEIKQDNEKNCFLHYEGNWRFIILLLDAEQLLAKAFRLGYEKTLYVSIEY